LLVGPLDQHEEVAPVGRVEDEGSAPPAAPTAGEAEESGKPQPAGLPAQVCGEFPDHLGAPRPGGPGGRGAVYRFRTAGGAGRPGRRAGGSAGGAAMTAGGAATTAGSAAMTAGSAAMTAGGAAMTVGSAAMIAGSAAMIAGSTAVTAGSAATTAGGAAM